MNDTAESLIAYCRENSRVCPEPGLWHNLWALLPERRQIGAGWQPSLPLILAARDHTSNLEKLIGNCFLAAARFRQPSNPAPIDGGSGRYDESDAQFLEQHRTRPVCGTESVSDVTDHPFRTDCLAATTARDIACPSFSYLSP